MSSSSNSTTWSCLGEPRLISLPITAQASSAASFTWSAKCDSSDSRWSTSTAMPARSMPASDVHQGQLDVGSSAAPPRWSSSVSRASARSTTALALIIAVSAAASLRHHRTTADRAPLPGASCGAGSAGQVRQVVGTLVGTGQVGRQRGVAGDTGQLPAAGGQREHRTLRVVQRLRAGLSASQRPARPRPPA